MTDSSHILPAVRNDDSYKDRHLTNLKWYCACRPVNWIQARCQHFHQAYRTKTTVLHFNISIQASGHKQPPLERSNG